MSLLSILNEGRDRNVAPALAAAVGTLDTHLYACSGALTYDDFAPACDDATLFDLASLTKVLSTTLLAAVAVAEGRMDLDETPFASWPGVTPRHLLAHNAGLPAWAPLYERAIQTRTTGTRGAHNEIVRNALAMKPVALPGEKTVYSDIGFIALGDLLAGRLHGRLDHLFVDVARQAFGPTGLTFVPLYERGYAADIEQCAPTEVCGWRGRAMQGQVHDDNTFAMGGIAGHAGLFGTIGDVQHAALSLLQLLCSDAHDARFPPASVLREFARAPGERGLGFDRPTEGGSTGDALSTSAVGHLGFTGTSIWLDPHSPVGPAYFVLLTNRVHPSRENNDIRAYRRVFHHAAMSLLRETVG